MMQMQLLDSSKKSFTYILESPKSPNVLCHGRHHALKDWYCHGEYQPRFDGIGVIKQVREIANGAMHVICMAKNG